MFGLKIRRFTDYISVPSCESYDTLLSLFAQSISFLHVFLNKEIAFFGGSSSSSSHRDPRLGVLLQTRTKLLTLYKEFVALRMLVAKNAHLNHQDGEFTSIAAFYPRYRGFLLTAIHKLCDLKGVVVELRSRRLKAPFRYIKRLELIGGVMKRFAELFSLSVRLERSNVLYFSGQLTLDESSSAKTGALDDGCAEPVATVFPFNPCFPLSDFHFDSSVFYESIGKQFVPTARLFFEVYVGMLAGLYDTVRVGPNVLPAQLAEHDLVKLAGMNALGAAYQLWPKGKARKNAEFAAEKGLFEVHGYQLWNAPNSVWLKPLLEAVLPQIAVSKTFEVPVGDLLRPLKKEDGSEEVGDADIIAEEAGEDLATGQDSPNDSTPEAGPSTLPPFVRREVPSGTVPMECFSYFHRRTIAEGLKCETVNLRIVSPFPLPVEELYHAKEEFSTLKGVKQKVAKGVRVLGKVYRRVACGGGGASKLAAAAADSAINFVDGMGDAPSALVSAAAGIVDGFKGGPFGTSGEFLGDVIFHIHGGGFIAMSSHSHEMYLRRWCNNLRLPVVSVDYTNAPVERHPTQVLQCFAAYRYFVKNAEKMLGRPLRRVIVAGDSAGGNLVVALTLLAIAEGVRIPDAVISSYPTLMTSYEACPSRVMSFVDPLISKPFLELCLKLYPKQSYTDMLPFDPFISPLAAPDAILAQFPPTYIIACSLDPLYDDGVALAKRLDRLIGGKVSLTIMDGLPHGFLNFCDLLGESRDEIRRIGDWVKSIIHDFYKEPTVEQMRGVLRPDRPLRTVPRPGRPQPAGTPSKRPPTESPAQGETFADSPEDNEAAATGRVLTHGRQGSLMTRLEAMIDSAAAAGSVEAILNARV